MDPIDISALVDWVWGWLEAGWRVSPLLTLLFNFGFITGWALFFLACGEIESLQKSVDITANKNEHLP